MTTTGLPVTQSVSRFDSFLPDFVATPLNMGFPIGELGSAAGQAEAALLGSPAGLALGPSPRHWAGRRGSARPGLEERRKGAAGREGSGERSLGPLGEGRSLLSLVIRWRGRTGREWPHQSTNRAWPRNPAVSPLSRKQGRPDTQGTQRVRARDVGGSPWGEPEPQQREDKLQRPTAPWPGPGPE